MTRSLRALPLLLAGLAAVVLAGCGGTALTLVDGRTGVCGLLHIVAVIWAFVQIANSTADQGSKVLWGLAVFFFPVFGLLAWYVAGPKGK